VKETEIGVIYFKNGVRGHKCTFCMYTPKIEYTQLLQTEKAKKRILSSQAPKNYSLVHTLILNH
jgi:hypothetical protein